MDIGNSVYLVTDRQTTGAGLDREESPLRLAESGPVVLSPKSMKVIPREAARSVRWGKKFCTVHPRGSQTSQNEEGRMSKGRMKLEV